jgi:hypothetical protein
VRYVTERDVVDSPVFERVADSPNDVDEISRMELFLA